LNIFSGISALKYQKKTCLDKIKLSVMYGKHSTITLSLIVHEGKFKKTYKTNELLLRGNERNSENHQF
jgi:hypothetical protein